MNLSQRAIALCRMKYGKGELIGFEDIDNDILNDLTEDEEESVIRELAEAEFLESTDGNIHLGALAHHLLNMMIEPEQQIRIDNELNSAGLTVYIRNAYYLCVIDDKNITKADDPGKYTIELLPRLDLVVGAFTYALGSITPEHDINKCLKISGRAWDKDRSLISEISLPDGAEDQPDVSSLINTATIWMLENIAAGEHDTDIYEDQISDSPEV
ncbi:MAG: hypothetical protein IKG17_06465 [Mogibacterium sp.]|nr:hypothetical protein [Mogibacterium sp.]